MNRMYTLGLARRVACALAPLLLASAGCTVSGAAGDRNDPGSGTAGQGASPGAGGGPTAERRRSPPVVRGPSVPPDVRHGVGQPQPREGGEAR